MITKSELHLEGPVFFWGGRPYVFSNAKHRLLCYVWTRNPNPARRAVTFTGCTLGGLHVLVLRGLCVEGKAAIIAMLSRRLLLSQKRWCRNRLDFFQATLW